jgi:hypothetical protein
MILMAFLSRTTSSIPIPKFKSFEISVVGAMDISGYHLSSMAIWYVDLYLMSVGVHLMSVDLHLMIARLIPNQTAVFKNQIDWIPLSTGSVRPTQGRTLAIAQVSGGSQSFNTVNSLRMLGRWMRMFAIPNQSSIPKAYTQFTGEDAEEECWSRLIPSGNRDRLVDCMEEFVKYTIVMRPHFDLFGDRFSERTEKLEKQRKLEAAKAAIEKHAGTEI